ncbi:MAG TPA: hypothetical protein DCL44_03135 [Elusimicrobia bacterium]|nr:hypothetical protein [Elusimicrobiota bacterium]
MNRKVGLGIILIATVGVLVLTRAKNAPPSDLRDAVGEESQAPEINTNIPAVGGGNAELPVPTPVAVEEKQEAPVPANSPMGNFGVVSAQDSDNRKNGREWVVYRGSSLDNEAAYAFLRDIGVSVSVNLQSSHPSDLELCAKYGLTCRKFGIYPFDRVSLTRSSEFQAAFRFVLEERKAGHKVYIHCMKGKDRTGALAAALMIRERACVADFNKAKLRDVIEKSLDAHNFWRRNYPKWHAEIIGWVDNFEDNKNWLCKQ